MLSFRSLASGSSGNAYLLQTGKAKLLFDAGLRLSRLRSVLADEGLHPEDLTAVVVSHEHVDHCVSARDLALECGTPVWANADVLRAAGLHDLREAAVLHVGRPMLFGDVEVTSFPVSHDAVRPVGFLIRVKGRTITIATDLGEATPELLEAVSLSDLVVLEANHDLEMLHRGRYPYHLRRRVSSRTGHLSNHQAAKILESHLKGEESDVWLAHLSKENNVPKLALKTVRLALAASGLGSVQTQVALRDRPSLRWNGNPRPKQLSLFPMGEIL